MVALTNGLGNPTSRLKFTGLCAMSFAVLRRTAPVDAPSGTRAVSAVEFVVKVVADDKLNASSLSAGSAPRFLPAIVTNVLGNPAGGFTKRMRGPSGLATCTPVSVPWPELLGWVQAPEAVRLARSNAVSTQSFSWQGDRSSDPVTLPAFAAPATAPSMQSMSPRREAMPVTPVSVSESSASQVPVTSPCGVLVPVHVPAHTPARFWGGGLAAGVLPPSLPPLPHAYSSAVAATAVAAFTAILMT